MTWLDRIHELVYNEIMVHSIPSSYGVDVITILVFWIFLGFSVFALLKLSMVFIQILTAPIRALL